MSGGAWLRAVCVVLALGWLPACAEYRDGVDALSRGDYPAALETFRVLAAQGHPRAQWALGYMYRLGLGVPRDEARADEWQERATQSLLGTPERQRRGQGAAGRTTGSGTGLLVDELGHVLTNHHVVEGCAGLRVVSGSKAAAARVVAREPVLDLALLAVDPPPAGVPAEFRARHDVRLGETVLVAGYPLREVLAADLHVFAGMVSALAGPRNDPRLLLVSAAVQPGGSGGPVLDQAGQVVGVVVGQLGARSPSVPEPQNIGFAIRAELARTFLDVHGVRYRTGRDARPLDPAEVAARARGFTVVVECRS
jgi:S1-C subfamily serine protease